MSNKDFAFEKRSAFLGEDSLRESSLRFEEYWSESNDRLHNNVIHLDADKLKSDEALRKLANLVQQELEQASGFTGLTFHKLWLVKSESSDTDKTKLPYLPHFDKRRVLKGMLYLHDVEVEHGPIHFAKAKEPLEINARRKRLPENYKELGLNSVAADDLASSLEPVNGRGGDLVLFDTNVPHCAGIVKKGFCRKVLRFDFEHPSFNPSPSFFQRLKNKLIA